MHSIRENERLLTERACTVSGGSLRFIMPVENHFVSSIGVRKYQHLSPQQTSHTGSREELPGVGFQGLRKPLRRSGAAEALPGFFQDYIFPFSSAIFASLL